MVKRQQYYDSLEEAAQDTKSLKKMCQLILTKSNPLKSPLITYNTAQDGFDEVLREILQKDFLAS